MIPDTASSNLMPRRKFGDTGEELSIIGFGGIVVMNATPEEASSAVAYAIEKGVNYFDVAPSYGNAEEKLGPAMAPYRDQIFLACKTHERSAEGAKATLENSLRLLETDHFDLYQLHALIDLEKDVDAVFGSGGAMEVLEEAKRDGRVKYLGFSAHSEEAALAAMDRYDFDSVLFPVNFATLLKHDFGAAVLARAEEKGMARLALKGLARQQWPENDPLRETFRKTWYMPLTDPHQQQLALRFTLSQGVTAAVSPGEEQLLRDAIGIALNYSPVTETEIGELKALAEEQQAIFPQ